jgi:tetratricopeptide (TPR) repeat protein
MRMRSCFALLLMCLFASAPAGAATDTATRRLVEAGHWKQARAILEPRVKANLSDAEAAALLSSVRAAYGDLEAALGLAETAVRLEPKVAVYHQQLAEVVGTLAQRANVFKQVGLARRYRQEIETAMALDPALIDARMGMMEFYLQAPGIVGGDTKKGAALADEIGRIDPASGFLAKARVMLATKATGDLESLYRQAAGAAKTADVKYEATSRLLNLHLAPKTLKSDAAEQEARALLQIDPHRSGGYAGLALVYATAGRLAELDAVLADAEKAIPDNFGPFYQAARALLIQGQELTRAERYLRKYLTQEPEAGSPGLAQAHWRLGLVLEKQGQKSAAVAELDQAVKLKPDFDEAKKDLKRLR